jgi:hypothetical protein
MQSATSNTAFLPSLNIILLVAGTVFVQPLFAKTVNFAAGGDINYKQAKIGFINRAGTQVATREPNLLNLNAFFAMSIKRFYFTVNADTALLPDESTTNQANIETKESIERTDGALTVGFNMTKGFSLFGGFFYGDTSRNVTVTNTSSNTTVSDDTMTMSEFGPFVGLNYTLYFKNGMSLGFNGAYALMAGEQSWGQTGADPEVTYKGNTKGTSLGVKFSGPIGRIASYYVGIKATQYSFKTDDSRFKTDEDFQALSAGVSFYF